MHHLGVAPLVGAFPTAITVASEAVNGTTDWATYASQLGVGAVLVAFAVWLQDRMAKERKGEIREIRNEMAELRKQHATEMAAERQSHDATRQALFSALTGRNPS